MDAGDVAARFKLRRIYNKGDGPVGQARWWNNATYLNYSMTDEDVAVSGYFGGRVALREEAGELYVQ